MKVEKTFRKFGKYREFRYPVCYDMLHSNLLRTLLYLSLKITSNGEHIYFRNSCRWKISKHQNVYN